MAGDQVITVRGERELVTRAGHLFSDVTTEFVCAATDMNTWSHPGTRTAVAARLHGPLNDGLVVRKLYSPAALTDDEQRRHLLDLSGVGAQVRICRAGLPHETIIFDRRVMVLAGAGGLGDREFTVTNAATLINGVYALFEAAWETADELRAYLRRDLPQIDAEGREILRVLGTGVTDEVGARQVGVSLRTYRRRVAELMRLLEAESRFQAGVQAGGLGLIP